MSKQANMGKQRPAPNVPTVSEEDASAPRRKPSPLSLLSIPLILILTAALCGLAWYLYPLHYFHVLLFCGFTWGALLTILLWIQSASIEAKMDRIATRLRNNASGSTDTLLNELQRAQEEQGVQLRASAQQLDALQTQLDTNLQGIEQLIKTIEQPGEREGAALQRVEAQLEVLKTQAQRTAETLRGLNAAAQAPPEPLPGFHPTQPNLPPSRLIQEATAYFAALLANAGEVARVAFEALQKDARSSLDLENDLNQRGDQMLQPANTLEWERIERDIYRPLSLLVSSLEMTPEESRSLFAYIEEIDGYRRSLHQLLESRFRVQRIPILPEVTKLDPNLHNPVEDSWLKTTVPEKHLVIYEVVAAGFLRDRQLIRKATVKYYRHEKTEAGQIASSVEAPLPGRIVAQSAPQPVAREAANSPIAPPLLSGESTPDVRQETPGKTPNSLPKARVSNTLPPLDPAAERAALEDEERLKLDSDDGRVQKF